MSACDCSETVRQLTSIRDTSAGQTQASLFQVTRSIDRAELILAILGGGGEEESLLVDNPSEADNYQPKEEFRGGECDCSTQAREVAKVRDAVAAHHQNLISKTSRLNKLMVQIARKIGEGRP